ncbi:MAG: cell division protein FtsA [Candidatus Krumholzibacteriota bacterium]|nr:cell division protein FtsA [Candidatus Krumholzibacteriota bacterium]
MEIDFIVGIDIGSVRTRVLIAEITESGGAKIVGAAGRPSAGVEKGRITDEEKAAKVLSRCIIEAERMAGVNVEGACLSFTSAGIRSFSSQGVLNLDMGRQISDREIQHVTKNAEKIPLPSDRYVLHMLEQGFNVDENKNIKDPFGLEASRLEKNIHVVTAVKSEAESLGRIIKSNNIEIIDMIFSPFAAANSVLKEYDKVEGAFVIDIGGETTTYVLYHGGVVRSSGVIPVGGFNISNDLAIGLGIPIEKAEEIKLENCDASLSPSDSHRSDKFEILVGGDSFTIGMDKIAEIVRPRCEELFTLVKNDVELDPCFKKIKGNILLTGGGSKLKGIESAAENVFGYRVLKGYIPDITGLSELVADQSWNVSLGLLQRGSEILEENYEEKKSRRNYFNLVIDSLKKVGNPFYKEEV